MTKIINNHNNKSNSVMTTSKLTVSLENLDDITRNTLKFFFSSNLCSKAELTRAGENSNLLIVDYERGLDKNLVKNLTENNQYAIVLHMASKEPEDDDRLTWLVKPIQALRLKQNIDTILDHIKASDMPKTVISKVQVEQKSQTNSDKSDMRPKSSNAHLYLAVNQETDTDKQNRYKAHKHVGGNKDIDPSNPDELKRIFLTPEKYLYHYLAKAVSLSNSNKSDIIIKTLFGNILFEDHSQKFFYGFDENKIKFMQGSPLFSESTLSLINIDSQLQRNKTVSMQAKEMIWKSAISASKGRVPTGTSMDKSIEMKYWPNFSKLKIFRYAVQITAAWSRNALSLIDTASQLKIPQRYVFTLYCAMHAIECADTGTSKGNNNINSSTDQSIFTKILSHIFSR